MVAAGLSLLALIVGALLAGRLLGFIVAVLLLATLYSVRLKGFRSSATSRSRC